MIDIPSIDQFSFWIFLIPGFVLVWSFRYFTNSDKKGDFEFLGLGMFCGLLNLILYGLLIKWGLLKSVPMENQYSAAIILSMFSFTVGLMSAQISKYNWFKVVIRFLKSKWLT